MQKPDKIIIFLIVFFTFLQVSSQSIQERINNAQPEDTLIIPAGDYYGNLVVSKPITLQGSVNDTTNIFNTDDTVPTVFINAKNVAIKNLHIRGKTIINSDHRGKTALEITDSKSILLDSCLFEGSSLDAEHYDGTEYIAGSALKVKNSEQVVFNKCIMRGGDGPNGPDFNTRKVKGGHAVEIDQTFKININSCEISGGEGSSTNSHGYYAYDGGDALRIFNSNNIEVANTNIIGGKGGRADYDTAEPGKTGKALISEVSEEISITDSQLSGNPIDFKSIKNLTIEKSAIKSSMNLRSCENIVLDETSRKGIYLYYCSGLNQIKNSTIVGSSSGGFYNNIYGINSDNSNADILFSNITGGVIQDYSQNVPNGIYLKNNSFFRSFDSKIACGKSWIADATADSVYSDITSIFVKTSKAPVLFRLLEPDDQATLSSLPVKFIWSDFLGGNQESNIKYDFTISTHANSNKIFQASTKDTFLYTQ